MRQVRLFATLTKAFHPDSVPLRSLFFQKSPLLVLCSSRCVRLSPSPSESRSPRMSLRLVVVPGAGSGGASRVGPRSLWRLGAAVQRSHGHSKASSLRTMVLSSVCSTCEDAEQFTAYLRASQIRMLISSSFNMLLVHLHVRGLRGSLSAQWLMSSLAPHGPLPSPWPRLAKF